MLPLVAALAWAGLIFYLSSRSDLALTTDPFWDIVTRKIGHMVVFGILGFLATWTAAAFQLPRPTIVGVVVGVAYAASDEFHQSFVAGRSPTVTDVLIDSVGVLLGVAAWWWLGQRPRSAAPRR
jgi:VanZ family protein